MPNLESFESFLEGDFVDYEPVDVAPQMAVENGLEKFGDFIFFTLHLEFDPAVNQVPHHSNHVESGRDGFDGKAKADSLYASLIEDSFSDHSPPSRGSFAFIHQRCTEKDGIPCECVSLGTL
jgi:hypothetical protein